MAKASQLQYIDKLVDVSVEQAPRPIVEETFGAPQSQSTGEVVNVSVLQQRQGPMVQTVLKTVEVSQVIDKVVDIPM